MTPLLITSTAFLAASLLLAWYMFPIVIRTVRFEREHWMRDAIIVALGLYWLYGFGISKLFVISLFVGKPLGWTFPWYLVLLQCIGIIGCLFVLVMIRMADVADDGRQGSD